MTFDEAKRKLTALGYKVTRYGRTRDHLMRAVLVVTIDGYPVRNGANKFTEEQLIDFAQKIQPVEQKGFLTNDRCGGVRVSH